MLGTTKAKLRCGSSQLSAHFSLQPWTRLASPSWVAANVSYLKDMDVMESRILQAGKAKDPKDPKQDGGPKGNPNRERATLRPQQRAPLPDGQAGCWHWKSSFEGSFVNSCAAC